MSEGRSRPRHATMKPTSPLTTTGVKSSRGHPRQRLHHLRADHPAGLRALRGISDSSTDRLVVAAVKLQVPCHPSPSLAAERLPPCGNLLLQGLRMCRTRRGEANEDDAADYQVRQNVSVEALLCFCAAKSNKFELGCCFA